jgi:hypothetical protein
MGSVSFVRRVLFVVAFLLSAYQELNEFGADGGPAAKSLQPKFNVFIKNVSAHLGVAVPHIELKHVIAATIGLKGLGSLLFYFEQLSRCLSPAAVPFFDHSYHP